MMKPVFITIDDVEYELTETPHGENSCKLCLLSPVCSMEDGSALCQVGCIATCEDSVKIGNQHYT